MSLAKNIGGVSIGAELSYRHNTPLNAQVLGVAPGLPEQGDTKGPRGDTWHGAGQRARHDAEDAGVRRRHLGWPSCTGRIWSKVTSGANLFNAEGFAPCAATARAGKDKWDGCATKNYAGIGVAFTPTWYQVLPGRRPVGAADLLASASSGNAPTVFGGNQGLGNYSVGAWRRRAAEVSLRPEVHRLHRPLPATTAPPSRRRTASPRS